MLQTKLFGLPVDSSRLSWPAIYSCQTNHYHRCLSLWNVSYCWLVRLHGFDGAQELVSACPARGRGGQRCRRSRTRLSRVHRLSTIERGRLALRSHKQYNRDYVMLAHISAMAIYEIRARLTDDGIGEGLFPLERAPNHIQLIL